ncbi:MAG: PorT family protein [Ferruginibacter sp.]|nr:PorT family protein [Ferruginibacter sp.]
MKTKLLTLVLSTIIFSAAYSQSFHLGIKGGANVNKLTGKSFNDEFSFGYHLGGFAEIGLGKRFSVQPEVLFNQFNQDTSSQFKAIYNNLLSSDRSNIKLNYLSIPILLNFKASNILSLQAGPQFGILMDQNKKLLQNGQDAFKKGDFSMLGGVQLKFSSFRIYGRYALGLSNLNDIDDKDKWKSQSFQVGIGLAIL